jgi:drug/metabolite transporter (DMT)-like permease
MYWTIPLGVTFFYGFKFFALSSQKAGIAITSVAGNISVVIPVAIAFIFYGESLTSNKIAGILLAILSFFFIFKSEKTDIKLDKIWFYPVIIFVMNGANNSMTKEAERLGAASSPYVFLGLVFGIALTFATIHLFVEKRTNIFQKKTLIAGSILGILNFFSTYFFLNAITKFESSYFFPAYNLSYILLAAIIGYLVFKEKLKLINWFGILLAIFAILILTGVLWQL